MVAVQIYGSASNLASLQRYGLKTLEDARMDYMTALPDLEVYLGEVFREAAKETKPWQIFDLYIDECRRSAGEKAVGDHLEQGFFMKLGYFIQHKYLPPDSPKWSQIQSSIGIKFDFADSQCPQRVQNYNPAKELAARLFEYAVKGTREMVIKLDNSNSYKPRILRAAAKNIKLNPHFWRRWFYSLWGQTYEWGCFHMGERWAEANNIKYCLKEAPRVSENTYVLNPRSMLEAHGFIVNVYEDGRLEYYR